MKLSRHTLMCMGLILFTMLFSPYRISQSHAYTFEFQWTANHANDNVDFYRIRWGWGSLSGSNPSTVQGTLDVDDGGLVSPQVVDNVQWDIPAIASDEIACFAVTAIDDEGFESDFSNQICFGPVVAEFALTEDNYTSYKPSGWADAGAYVELFLEGGTNPIGYATADQYGHWTATNGIDFSGLPEGEVTLFARSNGKESAIVSGVMDSVTAKFSAGPGAVDITKTTATIMWSTSEATKTVLEYRTADASLPPEDQIFGQRTDNTFLIDHSMQITGLPPDTRFYYRVRATDSGNNVLISSEKVFKTLSGPDSTPPQVSLPVVEQKSDTSATISWNVDELCDSILEYGTISGVYPFSVSDNGVGNRSKTLTGLDASTPYFFRVRATDTSGNGPTTTAEQSFTTLDTPDTTPPVIDETTIDVERDHRSATITWETDESSDSVVDYGLTPSFGNTASVATYGTDHSVRIVALDPATTYSYRVGSTDADGNGPAYSAVRSFTTLAAPDVTPPEFDSSPTVNVTDTTATITWTTNEDSHSSVQYGQQSSDWDNYPSSKDDIVLKVSHSVTLTGLTPNTPYFYRIGIIDGANNGPTVSAEYGFLTEQTPDTAPPQFEASPAITGKTDTIATIEWSTDEESSSLVRYDTVSRADWNGYEYALNSAVLVRDHLVTLTNLAPNTRYYIRVGSTDGLDNGPALSQEINFRTDEEAVVDERPRVTIPPSVTGITNTSVIIEWQTDEPANGEVRFGTSESTWGNYPHVVIDNRTDTNHSVVLNNLDAETRYYFRVGSTDAAGNGPNPDPDETNNPFSEEMFTTLADPDILAPRIISGPNVAARDAISAIITWETDEPSNSLVQYGTSGSGWATLTQSASNDDTSTQHTVTLTNLTPTTTYYYMVGSQDPDGNGPGFNGNSTNPSDVASFTTLASVDAAAPEISNMQMTFATDTTALITWTTDEPANSLAEYGLSTGTWGDYDFAESDADMKTEHSITITNLQPGTQYFFRIASTDAKGNGPTFNANTSNPSPQGQFTTHVFPDTVAPQIPGDVTITVNSAERTALVSWQTPDEPGNSQVQYDTTSKSWGGYAFAENEAEMVRSHSVTLTNLAVNTIYYLRVSSVDASGNNYAAAPDDDNPSDEYNFFVERTAQPEPDSSDDPIGAIQEELEEMATCFIHSTGSYFPTGKTTLVFGVLVGTLALIAVIRVQRRRE
jgi:phosphodiesterase/alkaline phosphatase D-like protein